MTEHHVYISNVSLLSEHWYIFESLCTKCCVGFFCYRSVIIRPLWGMLKLKEWTIYSTIVFIFTYMLVIVVTFLLVWGKLKKDLDIVHIVPFEFYEPSQIVPLYLADVGQVLRGWTWGLGSVSTGSVGLQSLNLEFETKGSPLRGCGFSQKNSFPTFALQSGKRKILRLRLNTIIY